MTPKQSLKYHVALLLETHGQKSVLTALSETLKLTQADLEKLLAELEEIEPQKPKKPKQGGQDPIELLAKRYPDKADALYTLLARFRNRTFLSELRDIRRFFEEHSHHFGRIKSRTDALPKLARLLVDLELAELENLSESPGGIDYSALGIISDQILGRHPK